MFPAPLTPTPPPATASRAPYAAGGQLPLDSGSGYFVSAMGVKAVDNQLLASILSRISNPALREQYQTRVELNGEGGRALLRIFNSELAIVPIGVSNLTLGDIELMFHTGIPDFTRANVIAFHLKLDKLNLQLPHHLRISDDSLAAKYAAMSVHYDAEIIQQIWGDQHSEDRWSHYWDC